LGGEDSWLMMMAVGKEKKGMFKHLNHVVKRKADRANGINQIYP